MTLEALLWEEIDPKSESGYSYHVFIDTLHPRAAVERKAMFEGMQKKALNLRLVEVTITERRDTLPSAPHPECQSATLEYE